MISVIAGLLKTEIAALNFFEDLGGLVHIQPVPSFAQSGDGSVISKEMTGLQNYAIDYQGTDGHKMKAYVPNSKRGNMGFFHDNGGCRFVKRTGVKNSQHEYVFSLRFLAWLNLKGYGIVDTDYLSVIVPAIIKQLRRIDATSAPTEYNNVEALAISQMNQTPAIFQPFGFYEEGVKRGIFAAPYSYFGLEIQGKFNIDTGCVPTFTAPTFNPDFCIDK